MDKLIEDVCTLVDDYFVKKIDNIDWYYNRDAWFDANYIVTKRLENIAEELRRCNDDVNEHIKKFKEEHTKEAQEAKRAYWDDIRTQDYLERDLFE